MSLSLPTSDELKEMFDIIDLVNYQALPSFRQALDACRSTVSHKGVKSAQALTLRADGEVWLIQVGKRGGWKKLWSFGNPLETGVKC